MKVAFIPIILGALRTITEGLLKRLEDLEIKVRVEIIQITTLLRLVRITKRDWETWGDFTVTQISEKDNHQTLI